ncbi:MAG: hypothetical protein IJS31_01400 [Oscillospiraceae bacterium]|nr:hypothetical protein [Oscillospiraceae bacterium]
MAVLLAAAVILFFSFRSEISAVISALTYSTEELQEQQAQVQQELQTTFEEKTGIDLSEIEAEVAAEEQAESAAGGEAQSGAEPGKASDTPSAAHESPHRPSSSGNGSASPAPAKDPKDNAAVKAVLKRFYQLQSAFLGQLNSLPGRAEAEFHSLPKEEWTTANKTRIVRKYIGVAGSLEQQCDAQVQSLTTELRSVLKSNHLDTALADSVIQYYVSAKSLQKAEFLSKYKNYIT